MKTHGTNPLDSFSSALFQIELIVPGLALLAFCLLFGLGNVQADVGVASTSSAGQASTSVPDAGGTFTLNQALNKNSVNKILVTAVDASGHRASKEISVTQVSLDSIVVSKVTTERLSVEQVTQLVDQGVIKLDNPENFNVSTFDIVLTIASERVPVSVPIAVPKDEPEQTGYEVYRLPQGDGPGGARPQDQPPIEIVVFQQAVAVPDNPPIVVPGVILIEGNIKTLKEFYTVRLMLMNTSGIFTLKDVQANISFPDGGLSKVLPIDGAAAFGDIAPGENGAPGQAEKQFIIRGDAIGVRKVKVDFGGKVTGPGIDDSDAIPFNGSANSQVEVKGPPEFQVRVTHPDTVEAGVPYELKVEIANVGDLPALYASLELDVGGGANLTHCDNDTGVPVCQDVEGSETRNLSHILPGDNVSETFTVMPKTSGAIGSCVAGADQNIKLQVYVGDLGCLVGSYPPKTANPDGIPTVNVLPTPNSQGVGVGTPVTAFFSEAMNLATITTGTGGAFNVYDRANNLVPGKLTTQVLNDKTVIIWQVDDGSTDRLLPDTEYTVMLSRNIFDLQGNSLANDWTGRFTTTASGLNDTTPPALTLLVRPPVNPNHVIPGETVQVEAYASDQGSGIARVELRRKDLNVADATFELTDQKTASKGDKPPYLFSLDSSLMSAGHSFRVQGTAYDKNGNSQNATLDLVLADNAKPPTLILPDDPTDPILKGISILLAPASVSGSATEVRYYLDGAATPFKTATVAPFQAGLPTLSLGVGDHVIRAVARDGLGQEGEDSYGFQIAANPNRPAISFTGAVSGSEYRQGDAFTLRGAADDSVGIQSVSFYLDAVTGTPLATGSDAFRVETASLSLGIHRIYLIATNNLGTTNDSTDPASYIEFAVVSPPAGAPPASPQVLGIQGPTEGLVRLTGTGLPGARVDVTNATTGIATSVYTDAAGNFSLQIPAAVNDSLSLVAYLFSQSPNPSSATTLKVAAPPTLVGLVVTPNQISFNALNDFKELKVSGQYQDGSQNDLTGQAQFSSTAPAVAGVTAAGRVAALADGTANIVVTVETFTVQVPVTVATPTLTGLNVNPNALTFIGGGQSRQLIVQGTYSDGTTRPLPNSAGFLSNGPGIATVTASGLVTSGDNGVTQIQVSYPGLSAVLVPVTVKTLSSISLTPNACDLIGAGKLCQLAVTGTYTDGITTAIADGVTFNSANEAVATVSMGGLVISSGIGGTVVVAQYAGLTAQANVTIAARTPVELDITPASLLLTAVGQTTTLAPSYKYNDNTTETATGVVYASLDNDVATVSSNGLVTAVANGSTTISASAGAYQATVPVTVNVPPTNPPPRIDSIDRPRAGEGDAFVLRGQYFGALPLQNLIKVNGVAAQVQSARNDELTALVPKGATTGEVTVSVAGQISNPVSLSIYARRAKYFMLTPGVSGPATPGQTLTLNLENIDFRDGDVAFLSSAPDILAPLDFTGALTASVDGGAAMAVIPSTPATEITGLFQAGTHSLVLKLSESGGVIRTSPIYLVAGPPGTGSLGGERSVIASGLSQQTPVTFIDLRDHAGNPLPDGAKVIVGVADVGWPFTYPDGSCCISSAGGVILGGEKLAPNDNRYSVFTVTGGRIAVQYDPSGRPAMSAGSTAIARIQVLLADAGGNRIDAAAIKTADVVLSTPDTSGTPRSSTSAIADGFSKLVTITLTGIRDTSGNQVPDGSKVALTAVNTGWPFSYPDGTCCIDSRGGNIVNGTVSSNDNRFKYFTVTNGRVDIQYDPDGVTLGAGETATARVQVLPADQDGNRVGSRAFVVVPVTLTSAVAQQLNISVTPTSALADGGDNRVVAILSQITDALGNPAPEGTQVAVTAVDTGWPFTYPDGSCCISSSGGTIVNGLLASPNDNRYQVLTVHNGQVQIIYSTLGVGALSSEQSTTARIQVLPAQPDGNRIGTRAIAVAEVTLTGYQTAEYVVAPQSTIADGFSKLVNISFTGIRDTAGNQVPDGTKIAVTASNTGWPFTYPDGSCCIDSRGGNIVNGEISPNDNRYRYFTVVNGRAEIQYDPDGVTLGAGETATARVQVLPADPNGNRVGTRAFIVAPVTLSSAFAQQVNISVAPSSVLADGGDNRVLASVVNITDALGNPALDGTKVAVTASNTGWPFTFPDGTCCIASAGGTIMNGTGVSPNDNRFQVLTVQNGKIQIVYSAQGAGPLEAEQSSTARIQVLPAQPDNTRIGTRAIAVAEVTLTGYQTADFDGPGALASNAVTTYAVTNIRDTAGNAAPDGAKVLVTADNLGWPFTYPDGNCCVSSAGGTILNGEGAAPNDGRYQIFTVTGGAINVQFRAPASGGTALLQLLPGAATDGSRIGNRAFAVKSIAVSP